MVFQKKQIVICVAAVVLVGGFILFRYLPLQKKMKAIEARKNTAQAAITKAAAQSKQLPAIKEQLLHLQTTVGNYTTNIPAERTLGEFLHKIADLMNKHNLSEQQVQPGKEIKTEKLNCIPVSMRCKGRLIRIFEFYKSLQQLERSIRIEQVKLSNDTNLSGEVSMQTEAIIYYKPKADGDTRI